MKRLKGFTLIECLIAMFILGVSSLLLVQGYSNLMKLTTRTNTINVSLSQQMADAEASAALHSSLVGVEETDIISGVTEISDTHSFKVQLKEVSGETSFTAGAYSKPEYSAKIKLYMVQPYKAYNIRSKGDGHQEVYTEDEAKAKDGGDMRYVYFHM